MKLRFQLLDVTYDIRGNEPVIVIYARVDDNEPAVLFYRGFRPYFYAIVDDNANIDEIIKLIRKLSKPKRPILSIEIKNNINLVIKNILQMLEE